MLARVLLPRLVSVPVRHAKVASQPKPVRKVKAPVSIAGKAGKRAGEFFEIAFEREGQAGVARLEKELAVLDWAVKKDPRWDIETTSPFFPLKWKQEQVTRRIRSLGLSPLLTDLVMLLVENGEARRLSQVRVDYEEIMRGYRREVDVTLVSGTPLSKEHLELLQKSIQADFLSPQDNLIFAASVDKSILGGYKIIIKGQEHDFTWNRDIEERKAAVKAKKAAEADQILRLIPKPLPYSPEEAVKELRNEKEGILGKDFFARVVADIEAREGAIVAAVKGPSSAKANREEVKSM